MPEIKKVSWNTSEGLIMEISNRRSKANSYFIEGDIKKALNTLISIKQSVIQSFNNNERSDLRLLEEKFNRVSPALARSMSNSFNKYQINLFLRAKAIAITIYSEYNNKIMDLLEDRGYLIGEQSDASKMKF